MMGAVASATFASVCCIGPFLLLATGLGGAWMSRVMVVEPLQPYLVLLSLAMVAVAGWKLLARSSCDLDSGQSRLTLPERGQLALFIATLGVVLIFTTSEFWIPVVAG